MPVAPFQEVADTTTNF